jgi:hypothetical protein
MKVRELIEQLKACDPEAIVCHTSDDSEVPLDDGDIEPCFVLTIDGNPYEWGGDTEAQAAMWAKRLQDEYPGRVIAVVKGVVLP